MGLHRINFGLQTQGSVVYEFKVFARLVLTSRHFQGAVLHLRVLDISRIGLKSQTSIHRLLHYWIVRRNVSHWTKTQIDNVLKN